ncbi:TPA: hypothetical protein I7791_09965 [Vibrio vulnificus]|nr:hypothetical protein [Vibrio vulnificus]
MRGNDGYRKWRNFLPPSLLFVILANAVTHFKARGCFESIKPTKSVRSALAEAWIPACAGMTDTESNEISYRPWLLFVVLVNAGIYLKRKDVFESIKPTKNVRSALAEAWIPACAGMTGIESGEISYRPHFCSSSSRTRGPILKRANVFELIKPTKSVCSALAEEWIPACAGMTGIESGEISYRPWLLLVILPNAVTHLKREDVLSRLNRRKACAQRLLRNGFPPARE